MERERGFTWIEMLVVAGVVALLALMALPGLRDRALRKQVEEGLTLADVAKAGVQAAWAAKGEMPADNAAAGVPPSGKIVGNFVKDVKVEQGAITLTFGNNASKDLEDRHLTLRPAVVPDERAVPIAWICHGSAVPHGMEAHGRDLTDMPDAWLPVACRGHAKP